MRSIIYISLLVCLAFTLHQALFAGITRCIIKDQCSVFNQFKLWLKVSRKHTTTHLFDVFTAVMSVTIIYWLRYLNEQVNGNSSMEIDPNFA